MTTHNKPFIAGIGEAVWEIHEHKTRAGGTPLDFVQSCHQLGATSIPICRIGTDDSGMEILHCLNDAGISTDYVQFDFNHPTGIVYTQPAGKAIARNEIRMDSAWKYLFLAEKLEQLACKVDAVCFGILAMSHAISKTTIQKFIELLKPSTLKILDLSIGRYFYSESIMEWSLLNSNILKLCDNDLPILAEMFHLKGSAANQICDLLKFFNLSLIALTKKSGGSVIVTEKEINEHPGYQTGNSLAQDSSFTAALCIEYLSGKPIGKIAEIANRMASYDRTYPAANLIFPENATKPKNPMQNINYLLRKHRKEIE
ncbi:MAG: hypothetical protein IT569_00395 [Leptospiraceae bacterium]|nr:hypothetical protein [Leptospiraceae bacterium]